MASKKTTTARPAPTTSTKKAAPARNPGFDIASMVASVDESDKEQVDELLEIGRELRDASALARRFLELLHGDFSSSRFLASLRKAPLNVFVVFELMEYARHNEATELEQQYAQQRSENARKGGEATPMKLRATKDCIEAHWLDSQREPARYASNEKFAEAMTALYENAKHGTVLRWCTAWRKKPE